MQLKVLFPPPIVFTGIDYATTSFNSSSNTNDRDFLTRSRQACVLDKTTCYQSRSIKSFNDAVDERHVIWGFQPFIVWSFRDKEIK